MDIKLNYIDNSNDPNNSDIVIFQKNVKPNYGELAVAWKVIKNCVKGCNHPFTFPMTMEVSASDSFGNFTPRLSAQNGQLFHVTLESSGNELSYKEPASSSSEVQLQNDLVKGTINAGIYRGGNYWPKKLLSRLLKKQFSSSNPPFL